MCRRTYKWENKEGSLEANKQVLLDIEKKKFRIMDVSETVSPYVVYIYPEFNLLFYLKFFILVENVIKKLYSWLYNCQTLEFDTCVKVSKQTGFDWKSNLTWYFFLCFLFIWMIIFEKIKTKWRVSWNRVTFSAIRILCLNFLIFQFSLNWDFF